MVVAMQSAVATCAPCRIAVCGQWWSGSLAVAKSGAALKEPAQWTQSLKYELLINHVEVIGWLGLNMVKPLKFLGSLIEFINPIVGIGWNVQSLLVMGLDHYPDRLGPCILVASWQSIETPDIDQCLRHKFRGRTYTCRPLYNKGVLALERICVISITIWIVFSFTGSTDAPHPPKMVIESKNAKRRRRGTCERLASTAKDDRSCFINAMNHCSFALKLKASFWMDRRREICSKNGLPGSFLDFLSPVI